MSEKGTEDSSMHDGVSEEEDLVKMIRKISDFFEKRRSELEFELTEAISGASYGLEYFYKSRFGDPSSVSSLILPWLPVFRKLNAKSIQEFEETMKTLVKSDSALNESFAELKEVEEEWNEFLKNQVDPALNEHFGTNTPISVNPANIYLRDSDSDTIVSLDQYLQTSFTLLILLRFYGSPECIEHVRDVQRHLESFSRNKNCAIVLVCRGTAEGGRFWRRKTGLTLFPLLADDNGEFVDAFKFGRSVWNGCRTDYAKNIAAQIVKNGGKIAKSSFQIVMPDKVHDVHQMGGEVVLNSHGQIHCLHESKTSADRPSVEDILGRIPNFGAVSASSPKKKEKKKKSR